MSSAVVRRIEIRVETDQGRVRLGTHIRNHNKVGRPDHHRLTHFTGRHTSINVAARPQRRLVEEVQTPVVVTVGEP